jgi:hypothetical protein
MPLLYVDWSHNCLATYLSVTKGCPYLGDKVARPEGSSSGGGVVLSLSTVLQP